MRISFSGAACTGKTTTINAFLNRWTGYKKPEKSYRDLIVGNNHSKKTDKKIQLNILNFMAEQQKQYTPHDKIVYDRCPLDNIVYSIWANDKGRKGFTDKFISECVEIVKESMRSLDVIFLMTRDLMGPIQKDGKREDDPLYIMETDNIFKAIHKQLQTTGASPFFPHNDSPAIIEIHGTVEERLAQIALYVNEEGDMYDETQSLVNVDEIVKMESLLREQKGIQQREKGILPNK